MRCLVFLLFFIGCPVIIGISGNERTDSVAFAALQEDVSECLISYTDAYQYIGQYVRDLCQSE